VLVRWICAGAGLRWRWAALSQPSPGPGWGHTPYHVTELEFPLPETLAQKKCKNRRTGNAAAPFCLIHWSHFSEPEAGQTLPPCSNEIPCVTKFPPLPPANLGGSLARVTLRELHAVRPSSLRREPSRSHTTGVACRVCVRGPGGREVDYALNNTTPDS
jgi:hypothetical protein